MNYDRDEYMRRQDAEHDMIRMRERLSPRQQGWKVVAENAQRRLDAVLLERRHMVDRQAVARMIESAEIAPIIKQRLIAEVSGLKVDRALRDSDGNPKGGDGTAPARSADSAAPQGDRPSPSTLTTPENNP